MVRLRAAVVRVAALAALAGCQAKKAADAAPTTTTTTPLARDFVGTPEPLPAAQPDAPIGEAGPSKLLAADDGGAWQVLCHGEPYRPFDEYHLDVVVGGGDGLRAGALLAAAAHDLLILTPDGTLHVDVTARTTRKVAGVVGAIDDASRRVVLGVGQELVVRDPGKAPRIVPAGGPVASVALRTARWAAVTYGSAPTESTGCEDRRSWPRGGETIVDLDPSGAEAVDVVGPQIGITPAGEITLRGEVVIGAECVGDVIAALADPPRALAYCRDGRYLLAAPGAPAREIGNSAARTAESSTINEQLVLGQRILCVWGACMDLVDGTWFSTFDEPLVIFTTAQLVRRSPTGLVVDDVLTKAHTVIALPQIAQAVTVDAVTGRRKVGAPPPAALQALDLSGDYLLYGRFVVDLAGAKVTQTLADDAIAVDRTGRALVPAGVEQGPLHWVGP